MTILTDSANGKPKNLQKQYLNAKGFVIAFFLPWKESTMNPISFLYFLPLAEQEREYQAQNYLIWHSPIKACLHSLFPSELQISSSTSRYLEHDLVQQILHAQVGKSVKVKVVASQLAPA